MQAGSRGLRSAHVIAVLALVCLFVGHVTAAYAARHRDAGHDELQYLHVGWLLAQGQSLYRDFIEDHSPFLFVILKGLVPSTGTTSMPLLDVLEYVARARAVTSACGVLALAAIGLLVYRATRNLFAPVLTIATLLASNLVWHGALTDVRNDPPGLLLFWLGALLVVVPRGSERTRFAQAGIGIGLAFAGALWNPKMPFECLVIGAAYLWRLKEAGRSGVRMVATALAGAIAIPIIVVLLIASTVSLSDYVFFTFELNRIIAGFFATSTHLARDFYGDDAPRAFLYCDRAFKGLAPLVTIAITAAILVVPRIRRQAPDLNLSAYGIVLALALAALLDIRFIFSYPNLWPQYYFMWDFAMAALYGMAGAALLGFITNVRLRAALQIAATILTVVLVLETLPRGGAASWMHVSYLQQRLRPNETVWLDAQVHPIAVNDASYYWFAFDLVPMAVQYSMQHPGRSPLPIVQEKDLPVCRAERGLEPHLRFVSGPRVLRLLPIARGCFERMITSGRAVRTLVPGVWDLRPSPTDVAPNDRANTRG
jgi:hypothetical protein